MLERRNIKPLVSPWRAIRVILIALLFAFVFPLHTSAATIVVSTTTDVRADDGQCSLREAIIAANTDTTSGATPGECSAGNGPDVITLGAQTYTLSIAGVGEDSGLTGDLDITNDLTINGAGSSQTIIDGGGLDRVIEVAHGVNVSLNGMTIQNGFGSFTAGIYNEGLLALDSVSVSNNSGIGIVSFHDGSPSPPFPTVDIVNSLVSNNTSNGIHATNTMLTVDLSTISGNQHRGIQTMGSGLTVVDSTISGNSSSGTGGGLSLVMGATDVIVNSTISGNTATDDGGGIYFWGFPLSSLDLQNVSIVNNTADSNHTNSGDGGGIYVDAGTGVLLTNSIVAANIDGTSSGSKIPDCSGALSSGGYNLIGAVDSACAISGDTTGNQTGSIASPLNPQLSALQDNGGPTETHALMVGSPAIDMGNPSSPGSGGGACRLQDQRGWFRPIDGDGDSSAVCDIGAYEKTIDLFLPLIMR